MGTIRIGYKKKRIKVRGKFGEACIYKKRELEEFNPKVLGLGDIGAKSEQIGVIAAFFDLSGFTSFCSQVDPHLSMPKFLNEFVKWLFEQIKRELQVKEVSDGIACYSEVPFFAKFMGDGVLFLWNTKGMDDVMICNIATTVWEVCDNYYSVFIPRLKGHWSYYPNSVRCGVACGNVCSVGNGGITLGRVLI